MTQSKFQAEPVGITNSDNPYLSILCQVYFNSALNGDNICFLDECAPKNSLSFLIKGNKFLHPANYNLFPIDHIESAIRNCGGAICLNSFTQKKDDSEINYKLIFSVINPDENDKIVMGWMFINSAKRDDMIEVDFANALMEMKSNYNIFKSELAHLQDELISDCPTIMVDRKDGNVVAANFEAQAIFKDNEPNLLNKNFNAILKNSQKRHNLTVTNQHSHKDIPAIIKIETTKYVSNETADNPMADVHNRLENIIRATTTLEKQLSDSFENRINLETIKNETGSITDTISNYNQEIKL